MNESLRPVVSTAILMVVSIFIALGSLFAFSMADVHNRYDFLVPVIGIAQLVFTIGLFTGKLWGLFGYTATVIGLIVATFAYYVPKGQTGAAVKTSVVFVPLASLVVYYWTVKRGSFS